MPIDLSPHTARLQMRPWEAAPSLGALWQTKILDCDGPGGTRGPSATVTTKRPSTQRYGEVRPRGSPRSPSMPKKMDDGVYAAGFSQAGGRFAMFLP